MLDRLFNRSVGGTSISSENTKRSDGVYTVCAAWSAILDESIKFTLTTSLKESTIWPRFKSSENRLTVGGVRSFPKMVASRACIPEIGFTPFPPKSAKDALVRER